MKGNLYIVATPIGNLADITHRALQILKEVNLIAAEDTRHSRKLLQYYGINTPLISLHEHNEQQRTELLLAKLEQGENIALISDAGTPLISDPGYTLVHAARLVNIPIIPIPGACAAIAALSASGLATDQFLFAGFLPAKTKQRQDALQKLLNNTATIIFYEAPHRILDCITDIKLIFGNERKLVLAKELTKTFETIIAGNAQELYEWLLADINWQKGEFVILIDGIKPQADIEIDKATVLNILLNELPTKQAIMLAAKITGSKKNELYKLALQQKNIEG